MLTRCKASCALFGGRGGSWVVAFDVDDTPGLPKIVFSALFVSHFAQTPSKCSGPQEGLRGCFCWLGGDWSHSLHSI